MMRRIDWRKGMVASVLCLLFISCNKNSGGTPEEQFVDNFKALVMGGKEIDAHQDWNTVGNAMVKVSVDFGTSDDYTVYISQTPLIFDAKAVYIGMAKLKSGESKTINIARPANASLLYAACYDSEGHAISKPFPVNDGLTELIFEGKRPLEAGPYNATSGNAWSVPVLSEPDLSAYTTGTLINPTDASITLDDDTDVHFHVSSDFTGFIPSLGTFNKKSAYVTATWTLSFNQQVLRDNVLIVGDGGKLVVPRNFKLTNYQDGAEQPGLIYVLPGGEITGEGTVEFTTSHGTYLYNAGTITATDIHLYGCAFYNSGTLAASPAIKLTCHEMDNGSISTLYNIGTATLGSIEGHQFAIENAGYLKVNNTLTLSEASKMDDGSYIECKALTLDGDENGGKVLYMGNAAFMNCLSDLSVSNFGVWGPSGSAFKANAILMIQNCTNCVTTNGIADTYLLDHVELIVPESFPTIFDKGALNTWDVDKRGIGLGKLQESFSGYQNLRLLYYWLNGTDGRLLSSDYYTWALNGNKYNLVWNNAFAPAADGVNTSQQTCFYSTSPSYNYTGLGTFITQTTGTIPERGCIYYLFETLESANKDFDYNDVVLRVSTPDDNGDGTFTSNVQVMCVGNTIETTVLYNGEPFGEEVHAAIGTAVKTPVNVNSVNRVFRKLGEFSFADTSFHIDQLAFTLSTKDELGNVTVQKQPSTLGEAPLFIVVNGNNIGKWFWPVEGSNIGIAYPQFSAWASNVQTAIDWYDSSNAGGKIVSY